MFFSKKKQAKEQTKKGRHAEVMRAKYAALLMGYHATADLLDEDGEEKSWKKGKRRRADQGSNSKKLTPVRLPIQPSPSSPSPALLT